MVPPLESALYSKAGDKRFNGYIRELSDNPILNAFCRVALSLRFSILAIFFAGVFLRADDFSSRTCAVVQARFFDFLFKVIPGVRYRYFRINLKESDCQVFS